MAALVGDADGVIESANLVPPPKSQLRRLILDHMADREGVWIASMPGEGPAARKEEETPPEGIGFFATAPILSSAGEIVGLVAVGDRRPRAFDPELAGRLQELADIVGDERERREALAELAEAEAEAQALNKRMKALIQSSPVAMVMTDRDMRVMQVSARWLAETELAEAAVLGRRIFDLFPGLERDYRQHYLAALAGQTLKTDRAPLKMRDGSIRWLRAETKPWRQPTGEIGGLLILSYDVTDLARALDAAEAANRAKSAFLANMSHEIRTPLNGVVGVAGVLARTPLTKPQRAMVAQITASAGALGDLLGDVLDLARAESGPLELNDEPFDVWEALDEVLAARATPAADKGLELTFVRPHDVPGSVYGDSAGVRRIAHNLLSNAIKFTETGEIEVKVQGALIEDRLELELSVRDTGVGFDEDEIGRLIRSFELGDGSLNRGKSGSGIGLALANAYVRAMGGTLEAHSANGNGATFVVRLPFSRRLDVSAPSGVVHEERTFAAAPVDHALRVLVADDHPVNRKVVRMILEIIGADLTTVDNGLEAVQQFSSNAFDVVLMDIQMPVMDGLTAIREMRRFEAASESPRTPILALTANAMPEDHMASRAAGADGHLTKPVTPELLLRAVQSAVDPRDSAQFAELAASRIAAA